MIYATNPTQNFQQIKLTQKNLVEGQHPHVHLLGQKGCLGDKKYT
jgi:hypothetical protein